jgi:aspartyl-tRNA(Asn)/glutamyl-tRNA(Gln) amidotransferase subunit A
VPAPSESGLAFLSIAQAARLLRRREISPADLVEAALAQIERWNPQVNAFITVAAERARRDARATEKKFRNAASAQAAGPLFGIPVSLKDNYWTRGIRTTAGSKVLADFVPPRDSDVAARLAQAGAILIGKTNMHEFAYGITNENVRFGPARNPWARDRVTGGSSGGSAAAVATGMCFASMGTDTGGSIRIPSALCSTVGLKPTFGLVSVEGIVPLALSLDHAGPLARTVADVRAMLEATASEAGKRIGRRKSARLRKNRRGLRLGWPKQYYFDRIEPEVRSSIDAAVKIFESLGASIREVSLPHLADSADPSTNIAMAEATQYHESQGYFPARAGDYSDDVRFRLERGREVRAVDYVRAFETKREVTKDFDAAFEQVDAIVAPASPIPAPRIGEKEIEIAGERETIRSAVVRVNRPANLSGHPALSIPCGFTKEGLPVGMQLIGARWAESSLLKIAEAYEAATDWHKRHPELL